MRNQTKQSKMAEALLNFTLLKPQLHSSSSTYFTKLYSNSSPKPLKQWPSSTFGHTRYQVEEKKSRRSSSSKLHALPMLQDITLMTVIVEHLDGQRDIVTNKTFWHLSDAAIKNVYTFYIMFTAWGCCFFGSTKDPYYDSEYYRKDGGDGTGHWVYEKQEEIEESARAELWREELIEEIEQKVGGLRELEESIKKEELVK